MQRLNVIKVKMVLFGMMSVQGLSLHSMEIIENEYNKKLLEIIAYNAPCDDYDLHRTLSLTNTACNKAVEDTHRKDKKSIEKHIATDLPQTKVAGYKSWNKDFSRCSWVHYDADVIGVKDLQLTLVGIVNNEVATKSAIWQDFYFPAFDDNIRPFFDKDGRACFYGYGKTQKCDDIYRSFAQYCLDPNGTASRYNCCFYYYTDPNDKESYYGQDMSVLLQYPVLAKAFLQSKTVRVTHCCNKNDRVKNFYTTGMIVPENYKFFKKSVGLEQVEKMDICPYYSCYTSYDSLDDKMRKAIDDQYEKQQQEKNYEKQQQEKNNANSQEK